MNREGTLLGGDRERDDVGASMERVELVEKDGHGAEHMWGRAPPRRKYPRATSTLTPPSPPPPSPVPATRPRPSPPCMRTIGLVLVPNPRPS